VKTNNVKYQKNINLNLKKTHETVSIFLKTKQKLSQEFGNKLEKKKKKKRFQINDLKFDTKMQGQPKTKTKGSKTLSTFPKHTKQFHSENQQCVKKKHKNQNLITKQKINRRNIFFSFSKSQQCE
jgi:hypothetical protein